MIRLISFCLITILFFSANVFADQVVMTNGDRLTGKIIKKDGDSVVIETEAAGTVKIIWSSVERIISDEPLSLTLEDGKVIKGKIQTEEDKLKVETSNENLVAVDLETVKAVRTPEEQEKFEFEQKRLRESKITDFWKGTVDAGFSFTSGNSKTQTFTGALNAVRETRGNKLTVYANALRVENATSGKSSVTAEAVWGGARFDKNFDGKWFGYGAGDFEYNLPQKLNVRAVLGTGLGYHAVNKEKTDLNLTFGVTNNYENFTEGVERNSAEGSFGQEVKHEINPRLRLNQRAIFYPNISRLGEFRAVFDSTIQNDLNNWLGLYLTIGNRYNSSPILQTRKNDFLFSTGLRISFGKKRLQ